MFTVKAEYLEIAVILSCIKQEPKHLHLIKDRYLTSCTAIF